MSGTLVPPTAPEQPQNYKPDPCDHGYVDIDKCPVCTPRSGMSEKEARKLATDRARRK